MTMATSGGMSSVNRRLPAATPPARNQRFAEDFFEGEPLLSCDVKLPARPDLAHERRIAEDVERRLESFVLVDVEQGPRRGGHCASSAQGFRHGHPWPLTQALEHSAGSGGKGWWTGSGTCS